MPATGAIFWKFRIEYLDPFGLGEGDNVIKMVKLETDETDFKIACMLKKNARLSYKAIGEKVCLSASSVYERIKKMEEKGVIKNYGTDINWDKFGYAIHAFILLKEDKILDQLPDFLMEREEIFNCWMVSGEYDYMLEIYAANNNKLKDLFDYLYYRIGRTRTFLVIDDLFYSASKDGGKPSSFIAPATFADE
jgi:DNA-binding Lrp family transcriptional regulator